MGRPPRRQLLYVTREAPPRPHRMAGEAMPALWALAAAAGITFAIFSALLIGWNTTMRPERPPQTRPDVATSLRDESVGARAPPRMTVPPSLCSLPRTQAHRGFRRRRRCRERSRPGRPPRPFGRRGRCQRTRHRSIPSPPVSKDSKVSLSSGSTSP